MREDGRLVDHARDDVVAEVVAAADGCVLAQATDQLARLEDVDPHRRKAATGLVGDLGADRGLLLEGLDPMIAVDLEDAEAPTLGGVDLDRADRELGSGPHVLAQHATVVHLVDVVAREDERVTRAIVLERIEVAIDRVGRAEVPLRVDAVVRRAHRDELLEASRQEVPAEADVLLEAACLVLGQDVDAPQTRVDAVAQREVDDAVGATEGDRGLGPTLGEGHESFPLPASEQEGDRLLEFVGQRHRRMRMPHEVILVHFTMARAHEGDALSSPGGGKHGKLAPILKHEGMPTSGKTMGPRA